jgi:hypothetical protein
VCVKAIVANVMLFNRTTRVIDCHYGHLSWHIVAAATNTSA